MKHIINNYYATEDGHIFNNKTNKILKERKANNGYLLVNLSINGKCKTYSVHKLIAKAFIPNESNLKTVNHKNGIKTDNRKDNLEWMSFKENIQHAIDNNLVHPARGVNTKYGKFKAEDIQNIRRLHNKGVSQYEIANIYNVTRGAIQQIIKRKTYYYVD